MCCILPQNSNLVKGDTMPGKCDICEKSIQFGHNVSHSKRHTNRQWKANTHEQTIVLNGKKVQANICTRCLRTLHKPVA